jgi:hypothetical protein
VKTAHVLPATCNFSHWITRHGSPTIYWCFVLSQLLYRWWHQYGIFWIHPHISCLRWTLLLWISYTLHAISYILHAISYMLHAVSYMLHATLIHLFLSLFWHNHSFSVTVHKVQSSVFAKDQPVHRNSEQSNVWLVWLIYCTSGMFLLPDSTVIPHSFCICDLTKCVWTFAVLQLICTIESKVR